MAHFISLKAAYFLFAALKKCIMAKTWFLWKKNSQKDKNVTHASVGESRQTEGAEVVCRSTKLTHAGPTSSKTTGVTNTK